MVHLRSLIVYLLFASALAVAQSDRGTVTGSVSDAGGSVIPNAPVVAANSETGVQSRTVTSSTGIYTISSLPVGIYDVSVEVTGFKKFIQKGVRVQVAATERIDISLEIGSASESVTVNADAALLKTEDAEQSETFSGDRLNSLPINFGIGGGAIRNPLGFVALAPGASLNGWNDIKVNGAPNGSFRIIFEGQDSTSDLNPRVSDESQPSMESIQEFTLQTSNFAPEFGQVIGGLFNFTARSGTNQFHGSAYGYSTNEDLGAGQPFTDSGNGHLLRPPNRQNDFGATIGGPVWLPKLYNGHDRTFFFFGYEMYRKHQGTDTFGTVPTPAMRAGDFSSILTGKVLGTDPLGRSILENTIYDPNTARTVNGVTVSDPFPNNVIPSSRFDPAALKIQALIPQPTRAGNVNNFEEKYITSKIQAIPTVKIDHNFNESSHLSGYYSSQRTDKDNSQDGFPDPLTARRAQIIRSNTVRLNYDHTISPTILLHLGAGFTRYHNPDTAPASITGFDVTTVGLKTAAGPGFPHITGLGNNSYGGVNEANGGGNAIGPVNENLYVDNKPTGVASVSITRGSHSYKAGGEWRLDTFTNLNYLGTAGNYGFSTAQTALASTQGQNLNGGAVGFGYASFLLGSVNNASVSNAQDPQYRKMAWAGFLQDTWRLNRKLTVTYGLRYDYQPAPHELYHRQSEFAPTVANPSAGGLLGATIYDGTGPGRCNCNFTTTYPYAIGPRLGGAYQIDARTVVRAGWGLTYGQAPNFNYIGASSGTGFNTLNFSNATFGAPALQLGNGIPFDQGALLVASYATGIQPAPGTINSPSAAVDRNGGRPSRTNQWNVSVQREIGKDLVIEAAYVGNRGVWEQANGLVSLNALTPQRIASFGLDVNNPTDYALLTSPLSSPQAIARGFKAPYAGYSLGNTVAQSLRPYPQFGGIGIQWAPLGDSWYDALQVKVTKRFSHGLDFTANYTRSKNLATAEDQDGTTIPTNDVFNRGLNKTLSRNDQPNIFVVAFNYQIPGWNRNTWTKQILGGWSTGGIFHYASGTPIQVPTANNNLNSVYFQGTFANRVAGQPLFLKDLNCGCIDPTKSLVLNPAAWSQPGPGQFGTAAAYYNDYRYARRPDEQINFGRAFRVKERMSLQVRAEFFNVFNRTYLNNPSNGNAQATTSFKSNGVLSSGFGYINNSSVYSAPRTGQIVARFQF
jgi:Carboxypeptidase regulatory-like domain